MGESHFLIFSRRDPSVSHAVRAMRNGAASVIVEIKSMLLISTSVFSQIRLKSRQPGELEFGFGGIGERVGARWPERR